MAYKYKVLFLCTGNSCRSQIAEAILRHIGSDRFDAFSAGSHPAGFIHPLTVGVMSQMDIPLGDQTSKSWDEFTETSVDIVITVCDNVAAGACPVWSGDPIRAHWSLPDPAYHPGTDEERLQFARRVAWRLRTKIEGLIELDWSKDRRELAQRLQFLGEI